MDIKIGDVVKHQKNKYLGTGKVQAIAKSGNRVRVDFGSIADWDRRRICPYPAYYKIDYLIRS